MEAADPDEKITFTPDDKIMKIQAVEFDKIRIVSRSLLLLTNFVQASLKGKFSLLAQREYQAHVQM